MKSGRSWACPREAWHAARLRPPTAPPRLTLVRNEPSIEELADSRWGFGVSDERWDVRQWAHRDRATHLSVAPDPARGRRGGELVVSRWLRVRKDWQAPSREWKDDESDEKGPGGGYGVPTGGRNGIFVVDLDVRPDKDGVGAFAALGQRRRRRPS